MSPTRPRLSEPTLHGFTHVSLLGTGGYADVYLFEQSRPRRHVAVKVLRAADLTPARRAQFEAEADLMAQVSAHPYIVHIFQADVADDGRPYLVMEYYPRPHLGARAATERLSVPEVLRIGIQLAGAVESAHRLGILHRDIKPANVLTSQYGRPGLTDFGISATVGQRTDDEDRGGMSIPWSAPEVFSSDAEPDERCDVYSLGATIWHLLTGRSPFEVPGGDNRPLALMRRIETQRPPSTGRDDVPATLERALEQAMRKKRSGRFQSAFDFARTLQAVQQEMHLAVTPIEVPSVDVVRAGPAAAGRDADVDATRLKPVTITPGGAAPPSRAEVAEAGPTGVDRTIARPTPAVTPDPARVVSVTEPDRQRLPTAAIAAAVLAVAGAALAFTLSRRGPERSTPRTPAVAQDVTAAAFVPRVDGTATKLADGTVRFSWSAPTAKSGDFYVVTRTDSGTGPRPVNVRQDANELEIRGGGSAVCIDVVHVRESGQASEPATICSS